jgi:hypothetical protein
MRIQPYIRKGRRRNVDICLVAWTDLLGYGTQIGTTGLNPINPSAIKATERIDRFAQIIKRHSHRLFPSLLINDAAAFYRNLSFRTRANTVDFLNRAIRVHYSVKNADEIGARTVISVGFKARPRVGRTDELRRKADTFVSKVRAKKKTIEQSILEALILSSDFNQIPSLNSNYAFTKSYMVDQLGSKHGFSGPGLFIEKGIFQPNDPPLDFVVGAVPCTIFGREYEYLNLRRMKLAESYLLDTIEIAKYLAGDDNVFERIFGVDHS